MTYVNIPVNFCLIFPNLTQEKYCPDKGDVTKNRQNLIRMSLRICTYNVFNCTLFISYQSNSFAASEQK
jgi:hypothetical protein